MLSALLVGKGCDGNYRHIVSMGTQFIKQLESLKTGIWMSEITHAVRAKTGEFKRRAQNGNHVGEPERPHQFRSSDAAPFVIVND